VERLARLRILDWLRKREGEKSLAQGCTGWLKRNGELAKRRKSWLLFCSPRVAALCHSEPVGVSPVPAG
jgi:hypothetical protein